MFAREYHRTLPFLTLFNASSSDPLMLWATRGDVRLTSRGVELHDDALIVAPSFHESLGIEHACVNVVFAWPRAAALSFEFHVDDEAGHTRRIRLSSRCQRVVCTPEMVVVPLRRVVDDAAAAAAAAADARTLVCVRVDLSKLTARHYAHAYKRTQRIVAEASSQGSCFTVWAAFFSSACVSSALWPAEFRATQLPE